MEENDRGGLLSKARHVGERLMEAGSEVSRLKSEASQAVEDGVIAARRVAKRSRYAAADLIDDAAHRVKRDPLRAVVLGFAIGLTIGALAAWAATHDTRE